MVGTVEDFAAAHKAKNDELTNFDRLIVPDWIRLEVPFSSTAKLKEWRDLMGGFLATVDFYLQPRAPGAPYIGERAKLFHLQSEARQINAKLRGYKGPGRPKKSLTGDGV